MGRRIKTLGFAPQPTHTHTVSIGEVMWNCRHRVKMKQNMYWTIAITLARPLPSRIHAS